MKPSYGGLASPAFALCLSACLLGGGGGEGSASRGRTQDLGAYRVEGGKVIFGPQTYTYRYCIGAELIVESDTLVADTVDFELAERRLKLHFPGPSGDGDYVIRMRMELVRQGAGFGLEGTWRATAMGYEVVSGILPAEARVELDQTVATATEIYSRQTFLLIFRGGRMSSFTEERQAEDFVAMWNGLHHPSSADSAFYDIDVRVIDPVTVEMRGQKSGETVRIRFSPEGDQTYSSSDSAHATHTWYSDPRSCPNDPPGWYFRFRSANAKQPGGAVWKRAFPRRPGPFRLPF